MVELTGDGGSASVHLFPYSEVVLIDVTLESAPDNHAISLLSGENKIILYGSNILRGGDNCCAINVPSASQLYIYGSGELEAYSGQYVSRNSAAIGTGYWGQWKYWNYMLIWWNSYSLWYCRQWCRYRWWLLS